jgi:hypothetical protein
MASRIRQQSLRSSSSRRCARIYCIISDGVEKILNSIRSSNRAFLFGSSPKTCSSQCKYASDPEQRNCVVNSNSAISSSAMPNRFDASLINWMLPISFGLTICFINKENAQLSGAKQLVNLGNITSLIPFGETVLAEPSYPVTFIETSTSCASACQ